MISCHVVVVVWWSLCKPRSLHIAMNSVVVVVLVVVIAGFFHLTCGTFSQGWTWVAACGGVYSPYSRLFSVSCSVRQCIEEKLNMSFIFPFPSADFHHPLAGKMLILFVVYSSSSSSSFSSSSSLLLFRWWFLLAFTLFPFLFLLNATYNHKIRM